METQIVNETKVKLKKPNMYNVIFHNDDYTTMEFVVFALKNVFLKSNEESTSLMMKIHNEGSSVVGTFTYDIAKTKKGQTDTLSFQHKQPLKVSIMEA